jgi:hypothetical protein
MPSATIPEPAPGSGLRVLEAVVALVLAVVLVAAPRWGFGFYAPQRGQVAAGEPRPGGGEMPRDRAKVRVLAEMAAPGERPSLADVVRFYGLDEDAVRCTVGEAHGVSAGDRRIEALSKRPLKVGETVTLCLD